MTPKPPKPPSSSDNVRRRLDAEPFRLPEGNINYTQPGPKRKSVTSGGMQYNPNASLDPSQVQDRRGWNQVGGRPRGVGGSGWAQVKGRNKDLGNKWNQPSNSVGSAAQQALSNVTKKYVGRAK